MTVTMTVTVTVYEGYNDSGQERLRSGTVMVWF
jgi:hypothetical protein